MQNSTTTIATNARTHERSTTDRDTPSPSAAIHDPVPRNDEPPQEMRTANTLLASFVFTVLGGALLIWGGSAFFVEATSEAAARDPFLPIVLGGASLLFGVGWMAAAFQKRRGTGTNVA